MANNIDHCYILKIYFDKCVIENQECIDKYVNKIKEIQRKFDNFKDIESGETIENGETIELDAGFDLFVPNTYYINPKSLSMKINHGINCSMTFKGKPTA